MKVGGYAQIVFPDGKKESVVSLDGLRCERINGSKYEADTATCFHCGSMFHIPHKPDVNAVGFCRNCMRVICPRCSGLPCRPFEKQLEKIEARYHARRSYGI